LRSKKSWEELEVGSRKLGKSSEVGKKVGEEFGSWYQESWGGVRKLVVRKLGRSSEVGKKVDDEVWVFSEM